LEKKKHIFWFGKSPILTPSAIANHMVPVTPAAFKLQYEKTAKKSYFNKVVYFGMNFGIGKEGVSEKTVKSD
jgi:hypothetical protein